MAYKITSIAGSHIGAVRYNHEDNFLLNGEHFLSLQQMTNLNDSNRTITLVDQCGENVSTIICAVADGMGGHQAGEIASLVAVQLLKQSQTTIIESQSLEQAIHYYQDFLNLLNKHVLKLSNANSLYEDMGTTLTTLILHEGKVAIISLGDSPGFVFSPVVGLTKLTVEQNYGQVLLSRREIAFNQLHNVPNYKHLTKYIGMVVDDRCFEGHVSSIVAVEQEKLFLLCSDGLTEHLQIEEIEKILHHHYDSKNWQSAIETLITLAVNKGGSDNITVMLIHIEFNGDER